MGQLLETVLEDIASSRELQTSFLKPHVRMVHGFQKIILLEDDSAAGRDYRNVGICPLRFKKPHSEKTTYQALTANSM
jgi:hypothetical protein